MLTGSIDKLILPVPLGYNAATIVGAKLGVVEPVVKRRILDSEELQDPCYPVTTDWAYVRVVQFSWLRCRRR